MRIRYTDWDGRPFPTQDRLDLFHNILDFVLTYGEQALSSLERAELSEQQQRWLDELIKDGLLEKAAGRWKLTPQAIGVMQRRALAEVFKELQSGRRDGHQTPHSGGRGERTDGTRRYEFGDPISELDVTETLRNAIARCGPGRPMRMNVNDFEVYNSESAASVSMANVMWLRLLTTRS